ncbi:MAG: hypothetical protein GC182_19405 [Rhodopseudomonas sp.]|nr:hypothetical protein [Rhodopseudomonas sp.]
MPQIWMTYEEIADLLDCGGDGVLARVRDDRLDCKISHDGRKRVKLDMALTAMFLDRVRATATPIDRAVADLRQMYNLMARRDPNEDVLFAAASDDSAASVAG